MKRGAEKGKEPSILFAFICARGRSIGSSAWRNHISLNGTRESAEGETRGGCLFLQSTHSPLYFHGVNGKDTECTPRGCSLRSSAKTCHIPFFAGSLALLEYYGSAGWNGKPFSGAKIMKMTSFFCLFV